MQEELLADLAAVCELGVLRPSMPWRASRHAKTERLHAPFLLSNNELHERKRSFHTAAKRQAGCHPPGPILCTLPSPRLLPQAGHRQQTFAQPAQPVTLLGRSAGCTQARSRGQVRAGTGQVRRRRLVLHRAGPGGGRGARGGCAAGGAPAHCVAGAVGRVCTRVCAHAARGVGWICGLDMQLL